MSIVSNNIKYLRRVNGLTQEQFARKIGIKRSLLGAYEEARANPNLSNLMNIAKIFGTSVDNLLKNDIRKLRENQSVPLPQPAPQLLINTDSPKEVETSKPIASIIETYYRSSEQPNTESKKAERSEDQLRLVAQRIVPRRTSLRITSQPLVFNKAYEPDTHTVRQSNGHAQAAAEIVAKKSEDKRAGQFELVRQEKISEYLLHFQQPDFLSKLPGYQLPVAASGSYRAFEIGADFTYPGATLIGQLVRNWYDLMDGKHYIVVLQRQGVLYRRVYNQVKIKGVLLLSSDNAKYPSFEVSVKEVLEVWEVKAFVSTQMPEPAISLERFSHIVADLQQELDRLKQ